ncbi:MAG TPA: polyphosphate kinase 2 family protein [Candidatus Polarisedimenticolia bacterium]|nr:polyphosphate kinase 2 family protein [Candidatus Polarisedimenticolia bacterium]
MNLRKRFRLEPGTRVRLSRIDPDDTDGFKDKQAAEKALSKNISRLRKLQYLLYAENRRALLIVLQAMDAGGKDGTIRHVMGGLNPQGCVVTSFKAPTEEEREHEFLWRIHKQVPARGDIGIFNRSHYEDVLVARVRKLVPRSVWETRYDQINAFEKSLAGNDVVILKFMLHISKEEQRRRLEERIENPRKRWKIAPSDFEDRKLWDEYQKAYEAALSRCNQAWAPWFVIPANRKWFRNLAVSEIIVDTLQSLDMKLPRPTVDVSTLRLD